MEKGLTYRIGKIPGWNDVAMEVDNPYIKEMRELNKEERELLKEYDEDKMDAFYERKNALALKFMQAINNGEISSQNIGIIYLTSPADYNTMYYDEILINIQNQYRDNGHEYSLDDDSFVILPPVIANMENGDKALYDFLANHVKKSYYDMDNSLDSENHVFAWQNIKPGDIKSNRQLQETITTFENDIEKYGQIMSEEDIQKARDMIGLCEEACKKNIQHDVEEYGITEEQANYMENYIFGDMPDTPKTRRIISHLMTELGKDFVTSQEGTIKGLYTSAVKADLSNLMDALYMARTNDGIIRSLRLEPKRINDIVKSGNTDVISILASNPYLTSDQAQSIRMTALDLEHSGEILRNLASGNTLSEDTIRSMYAGSEKERKAIISSSHNLPEDLIDEVITDMETTVNDYEQHLTEDSHNQEEELSYYMKKREEIPTTLLGAISVLNNNTNVSLPLLKRFYASADKLRELPECSYTDNYHYISASYKHIIDNNVRTEYCYNKKI